MSDVVIKIEEVSKQYRLGQVGRRSLSHDINRVWHRMRGMHDPYLKIGAENKRTEHANSEYVWALQHINFEVRRGEVLGIIGRNGAGKSTLLKILSKVTAPTTGRIKVKGKIASLLEVGTGFHPDLTGRDNIFLNGAILGMTRKEIAEKFDEIVDFAGVERYIDTPVKRYSSGMYVRLAFAVAAHLEPDILIVDEVLAVGDAEFQKKCLGKMKEVSVKEGRTVMFVSHNIAAVKSLCNNGILLQNGKLIFSGTAPEVIENYQAADSLSTGVLLNKQVVLLETGLTFFSCFSKTGSHVFKVGEEIKITTKWNFKNPLKSRVLSLRVYNKFDEFICGYNTLYEKYLNSIEGEGNYEVTLAMQNSFAPGEYYINMGSFIRPHTNEFTYGKLFFFEVSGEPEKEDFLPNITGGPKFYPAFDWQIKQY